MILKLFIFSSIFSIATSQNLYALDLSVPASYSQIQCIQAAKYTNLFVRGFKPDGQTGQVDMDGISTYKIIQNNNMKIGVDVYMKPDTLAKNTGAQQFDMLFQALTKNGINVRRIFVQVTIEDTAWNLDHNVNIKFLNSLFLRAKQLGIQIGIFTAASDWQTITGNAATLVPTDALLWYYSYYWDGVTGESVPGFDDFVAFGPFTKSQVVVKQFAHAETICGLNVNRDVYKA